MAFKKVGEILHMINKFVDESDSLIEALLNDYEMDIDDWAKMRVIRERLVWGIWYMVDSYSRIQDLSYRIENEKDRFETQKMAKKYGDDIKSGIDATIELLGTIFKFKDYRCIDFQKRLKKFICNIKVFFWNEE